MTRLAERLTQEFGRGFSHQNLYRMVLQARLHEAMVAARARLERT
ncbi:hypothetical protein KJ612_02090 [Myxococcota bacterium]|nr:hypothetical protein [Myxococcota bacterium]MBU1413944.1 hypothetical protein [Myxococcota bacterium]